MWRGITETSRMTPSIRARTTVPLRCGSKCRSDAPSSTAAASSVFTAAIVGLLAERSRMS
jgi:hypothetical protein